MSDDDEQQQPEEFAVRWPTPPHKYPCPTPGCPGDGRYIPPGHGHLAACEHGTVPYE